MITNQDRQWGRDTMKSLLNGTLETYPLRERRGSA